MLTGCVSYKAVGKFDDNSEILLGNVNHNLMAGGGKYEFTGVNTNINCAGIAARPDKYPFGLLRHAQPDMGLEQNQMAIDFILLLG
jgi:hypothetical protein